MRPGSSVPRAGPCGAHMRAFAPDDRTAVPRRGPLPARRPSTPAAPGRDDSDDLVSTALGIPPPTLRKSGHSSVSEYGTKRPLGVFAGTAAVGQEPSLTKGGFLAPHLERWR